MHRRTAIRLIGATAALAAWPGRAAGAEPVRTMTIVAKVADTPWFNGMVRGAEKAAADFGFEANVIGPETLDPQRQAKLIEDLIAKRVDVIGLVPVDPRATEPALQQAKAAGIKIITQEGARQAGRDWNVELVDMKQFAETAMQGLAAEMGNEGDYVVYVDSLTAPLHDQWADAAVAYQRAHFAKMRLAADPFAGADEVTSAYRTVLGIIKTFPNLKGILGFGSDATVGAGNAVRERQVQKKIALVGTSLPGRAKLLIEEGVIRQTFLWNPIDAGYAMVAVAKLLLDGQKMADGLIVPGLGRAVVDAGATTITIDKIMHVDKDNLSGWIAQRL